VKRRRTEKSDFMKDEKSDCSLLVRSRAWIVVGAYVGSDFV